MSNDGKRALIILTGSALLFLLMRHVFPVKKEEEAKGAEEPKMSASGSVSSGDKKKDALIILRAFKAAVADKQPAAFLNEMNAEFVKLYKMKVHQSKKTRKFFVADLDGDVILG